jgi:hypothetical protein
MAWFSVGEGQQVMSAKNLLMATSKGVTNTVTAEQVQVYNTNTKVAQVSTYEILKVSDNLPAVPVVGDTYTLMFNNETYTYTTAAGATNTTVLNGLVTRFNAGTKKALGSVVRSGSRLLISSDIAGLPFEFSGTSSRVDVYIRALTPTESRGSNAFDFDFGELDYDAGDVITITIGGTQAIYTVPTSMSPTTLVSNLASLINAEGVFYNRFANNKLTVLVNDNLTDVPITCTVTNT